MLKKLSHQAKFIMSYFPGGNKIIPYCIFLFLTSSSIAYATQRVVFIQGGTSSIYEQYTHSLLEETKKQSPLAAIEIINVTELNAGSNIKNRNTADIYLAIGVTAADALIKLNTNSIKILSLIPDSAYETQYRKNTRGCPPKTCKILTLDQPIERQLQILHLALPAAKNILILNNNENPMRYNSSLDIAKTLNISINLVTITSNDTLVTQLKDILPSVDVLLALPNNSIYNSMTARPILLTTYKYGVPIFSYSQAFIDAGAVIGAYSTPAQYARHTAAVLAAGLRGFKKGYAQMLPPEYFTIAENRSVAESLNLKLPDIESLHLKLGQQ